MLVARRPGPLFERFSVRTCWAWTVYAFSEVHWIVVVVEGGEYQIAMCWSSVRSFFDNAVMSRVNGRTSANVACRHSR